MTTVSLAMIVKNEAHVLARCLENVRPLVDLSKAVILDTGSTDGTQEIIASFGIPALSSPWLGFGPTRSVALDLARLRDTDYSFVVDADDLLEFPEGYEFPELTKPGYSLLVHNGDTVYRSARIFSNAHPWKYEGVLHETPSCVGVDFASNDLDQPIIRVVGGGARSLVDQIEKFKNDAAILREELKKEPNHPRNQFYYAQSLRDAHDHEMAIAMYEYRVEMGGWPEEVFFSLYQIGVILERIGEDPTLAYLKAWQYRPTRIEPLVALARYHRLQNNFHLAYMFLNELFMDGFDLSTDDVLFVDKSAYDWRALDEFAIAAYWTGRHHEAISANQELLDKKSRMLPASEVARVKANLQFSLDKVEIDLE